MLFLRETSDHVFTNEGLERVILPRRHSKVVMVIISFLLYFYFTNAPRTFMDLNNIIFNMVS